MTDAEFDVLDEVYFVTPYQEIKKNLSMDDNSMNEAIITLLRLKYIIQLKYDGPQQDFVRCEEPNFDDLEDFHYLATKEGLLAHNT